MDERAKNGPKREKIVSAVLHVSGTIHHMIVIYGTHVYVNNNNYRCAFSFFQNFDFLGR